MNGNAGNRIDASNGQETSGRPADCECHAGDDLCCWPCWRSNFRTPNPEPDADDDMDLATDGGRDRDLCRHASLADPSGGCPHCGQETTAVDLSDFGPDRGQLCPDCGIVFAATEGSR